MRWRLYDVGDDEYLARSLTRLTDGNISAVIVKAVALRTSLRKRRHGYHWFASSRPITADKYAIHMSSPISPHAHFGSSESPHVSPVSPRRQALNPSTNSLISWGS